MRQKALILVLGPCILALIALCVFQQWEIRRLAGRLAALEQKPGPAFAAHVAAAQSSVRNTMEKQVALNVPAPTVGRGSQPPAELPPRVPFPAAPPARKTAPPSTNESPMAGFARMMKNPGMKDMIRAQQKGQMDLLFGSLFKYLELSDADLETFKGLLLDKQMDLVGISMDMMTSASTPEGREAAAERLKKTIAGHDERIKTFLGDEDFTVYQSFEATQPERMQVNLLKGSLSSTDQLTEEQEDRLIRTMHDERTNFPFSVAGFGDNQVPDPSQFTPDRIAKLVEESAKLQGKYFSRAAEILTPAQLEQFKSIQKQQQAMQEMGMKMAEKMFAQPQAKTSTNTP